MFAELDIAAIVLLFVWSFGLAAIEIEIEGGFGWAERLPTWYLKRGRIGRLYGLVMANRPLTGYHVYAFAIPLVILHLPFTMGVDWSVAAELRTIATYFLIAVIWDYLWFVLNPAYTVHRFERGNVWWFSKPWIWRFPIDYYLSIGLSIVLAGLAALVDGDGAWIGGHLWNVAGLMVLAGITVLLAPAYHRWYRHMRRPDADDRAETNTYPPPAPDEVWSGGVPDLRPLDDRRAGQSYEHSEEYEPRRD